MNIPDILLYDITDPPSLGELFPELVISLRNDEIQRAEASRHQSLDYIHEFEGNRYDVVVHQHDGYDFFEFIPFHSLTTEMLRSKLRLLRDRCTRIIAAASFDIALQIAVEAVKDLTGFSRVKIYQFMEDWSGSVVAEARDDHMESYLGLHFPATDIPRQARYLYELLPYRYVYNVTDDSVLLTRTLYPDSRPVNMTWSLLRSVSPMHTAYLRNMGVASTFSVRLMQKNALWGLFACHHQEPYTMPYDVWELVGDVGEALMSKYDQEQQKAMAAKVFKMREVKGKVAEIMQNRTTLESSLEGIMPAFKSFMASEGFAFIFGGQIHHTGKVPPDDFIRNLVRWAQEQKITNGSFATSALHEEWPEAKEYIDSACGVLLEPVAPHLVMYLIWFRGPVTRTVNWAGNPEDKTYQKSENGNAILTPRSSFEKWVTEHSDRSASWTEAEVFIAREILKTMLDLVSSNLVLSRANKDLQLFSYAAAHDIQSPLRAIKFALDLVSGSEKDEDPSFVQAVLGKAIDSSQRLKSLIDQLLKYLIAGKHDTAVANISLNDILDRVHKSVWDLLDDADGKLFIEDLPDVEGSSELLEMLFFNLIENSIKYRSTDRPLRIRVTSQWTDFGVVVTVEDNGQGVDAKNTKKVFEPFQRMFHHNEIEGAGLGLSICKRIAEIHQGDIYLDPTAKEGTRIKVILRNSIEALK